jgi:uncharacterized protein involved in exopolysaccharide biosynthesis
MTTPHRPADPALTFGEIMLAAWRHRLWMGASVVAAIVAGLAVATWSMPRFVAETDLLIEAQEGFYTRAGPGTWHPPYIGEEAVASAVLSIRSRDLAREAVRRLKLAGHPAFDPGRLAEDALVERYLDALTVSWSIRSRVATIAFAAPDPELAARAANLAAALYLEQRRAATLGGARDAAAWLEASVARLRREVAEAEERLEEERVRAGLLTAVDRPTLPARHLSDLAARLGALRRDEGDAAARARLVRELAASGRLLEIAEVARDPGVRALAERRVALHAALARETRTLAPDHPRAAALAARLAAVDAQLRAAAEGAAQALEAEARIAAGRVEALQEALADQARAVAGANREEIGLRALEREARILREQLDRSLLRLADARARDGAGSVAAEARIVSRAVPPGRPVFPRRSMILALSVVCALMLAFMVLLAHELLKPARPEAAH